MQLNLKAITIAAGILWGGAMLLVSLGNLISADYGQSFLLWTASIYPGYEPFTGFGSVVVGSLYGLVDGAIAGLVFGWVYNLLAK